MSCDDEDFLPPRASYKVYRGDLFSIEFAFEQMQNPNADPDNPATVWVPYPVSGTLLCQVRAYDPDTPSIWTTPLVNDAGAASGIIIVTIDAAVMATADPGVEYFADLQIVGDVTLAAWTFEVEPDTSRPSP